MEFPKAFLLVTFYLFALAAANLDDQKREAIKKFDDQVNSVKKAHEQAFPKIDKYIETMKSSVANMKEFGKGVYEIMNYNDNRLAKSGVILAKLMGSSNDILKCVEYAEKDALTDNRHYYERTFMKILRMYQSDMEESVPQETEWWEGLWKKSIGNYINGYKKAVKDVQEAKDEETISAVVEDFDRWTNEMFAGNNEIFRSLDNLHNQYLRSTLNHIRLYKIYELEHFDETKKAIQECFPKFYKHEFLFNSKFFN